MALSLSAITLLDVLHLSDSALPIGSQSHSFGLETLIADETLTVDNLEPFLAAYIGETVAVDCVFCRAGHAVGREPWSESAADDWLSINRRLAALRSARELRAASATLGRHFLALVAEISPDATLSAATHAAKISDVGCHHAPAFGLVCGVLGIEEEIAGLAYAQQTVANLITAVQKLLPVGQRAAAAIRWRLKPELVRTVAESREADWRHALLPGFAPLVELAAMRHPALTVRLFVS